MRILKALFTASTRFQRASFAIISGIYKDKIILFLSFWRKSSNLQNSNAALDFLGEIYMYFIGLERCSTKRFVYTQELNLSA